MMWSTYVWINAVPSLVRARLDRRRAELVAVRLDDADDIVPFVPLKLEWNGPGRKADPSREERSKVKLDVRAFESSVFSFPPL